MINFRFKIRGKNEDHFEHNFHHFQNSDSVDCVINISLLSLGHNLNQKTMEENQQFKIESVDELKQVYGKYGKWWNPLKEEIKDFHMDEAYRWIVKSATEKVCLRLRRLKTKAKLNALYKI